MNLRCQVVSNGICIKSIGTNATFVIEKYTLFSFGHKLLVKLKAITSGLRLMSSIKLQDTFWKTERLISRIE